MLTREKEQFHAPEAITRYEPTSLFANPFAFMRRMTEDMDRLFGDFGIQRGFGWPRQSALAEWTPVIEVFQKEHQLFVKADLPGLTREDVKVEVTNDALILQGERKKEVEEKGKDLYRSELTYGSFYRTIPLPEGAITEAAKATFDNGVLEVVLPVPPKPELKARRLEIGVPQLKK
jgi:HSP20 family protein